MLETIVWISYCECAHLHSCTECSFINSTWNMLPQVRVFCDLVNNRFAFEIHSSLSSSRWPHSCDLFFIKSYKYIWGLYFLRIYVCINAYLFLFFYQSFDLPHAVPTDPIDYSQLVFVFFPWYLETGPENNSRTAHLQGANQILISCVISLSVGSVSTFKDNANAEMCDWQQQSEQTLFMNC